MLLNIKKQFECYNLLVSDYNKEVQQNRPLKVNLPTEITELLEDTFIQDYDPRLTIGENSVIIDAHHKPEDLEWFVPINENLRESVLKILDCKNLKKSEVRGTKLVLMYLEIFQFVFTLHDLCFSFADKNRLVFESKST